MHEGKKNKTKHNVPNDSAWVRIIRIVKVDALKLHSYAF